MGFGSPYLLLTHKKSCNFDDFFTQKVVYMIIFDYLCICK